MRYLTVTYIVFFFNDTATTEIYTYCTLFPYTTLFRSHPRAGHSQGARVGGGHRQGQRDRGAGAFRQRRRGRGGRAAGHPQRPRSEEHTSELQSLMRISYAVFCLKKKKTFLTMTTHIQYKTIITNSIDPIQATH